MFKEFGFHRTLILYGLSVPLALFLGYLLASAQGVANYALVALIMLAFCLPVLLRWHHALTLIFWNSAFIIFFIPGQPPLGFVFAGMSLFIVVLDRTLTKKEAFIYVPSFSRPLLFLFIVVIVTALSSGGIHGKSLGGSTWGAGRYMGILGAVIGYFAITARPIDPKQSQLLVGLFFLSGISLIGSDIAFALGPAFYFLFVIFPTELASHQANTGTLTRITGLAWASNAVVIFMIVRYGIRGILDIRRPWRLGAFLVLITLGFFGGFRSAIILLAIILMFQFYYEGLLRSKLFPAALAIALLMGAMLVSFVDRMPLAVQRTFSFLPLNIDPVAKQDADSTLDWRLQMWKTVLPDVPKYLLVGKGFSFDGTDYTLTREAIKKGFYTSYEATMISGNYHNGILTVIIPFGIWGLLGLMWLSWAGFKVLLNNYRYGDPKVRNLNTGLLALYTARTLFYYVFYGQFDLDLPTLVGYVAISISLNNGMRTRQPKAEKEESPQALELAPQPA